MRPPESNESFRLQMMEALSHHGSRPVRTISAVYPLRMAPIGLKLWENAFQVIPDISFFDAQNIFCDTNFCRKNFSSTPRNFFQQSACFGGAMVFWDAIGRCASKNDPRSFDLSSLQLLAEREKR